MEKIIHHIEISHTHHNLSWWEKAMIEIIKYIQKETMIKQIIYTSESWKFVYSQFIENKNIEYVIIGAEKIEKINPYLAYYLRIFQVFFYVKKFDKNFYHIIFSHEEFLPTSIYSFLLKIFNKDAKWLWFFHMKAPGIFRWYLWEYTWKKNIFPDIRIIRYQLEQYIYFFLIKNKINLLITVNPIYKDYLSSKFQNIYTLNKFWWESWVYVVEKYSGINIGNIETKTKKEFDLSFMWRFHPQKWIDEIIDIILKIKKVKPDIKIVIIWWWNKTLEDKFIHDINLNWLQNNIFYKWFITWNEKFKILSSTKIFLFPSYYESFWQVALEAMKLWLPVVAYDLPPFCVFEKWMIKVPILDNNKMVFEIIKLLNNDEYYKIKSEEAIHFSSDFSWEKTGEEIFNLIKNI